MDNRAASEAEHEVGPPELEAGGDGPADQDGQGYCRVEPGDIADCIADQRDHHPNRAVITEKANQFVVT